jgi:hypothetical protein
MKHGHRYPNLYLVFHVLAPSLTSLIGCFGIGILIVAFHIISLSLSYGTILPSIFNGNFAVNYTNYVVQPLETLFNNNYYGRAVTVIMWAIFGLIVYLIVVGISKFFGEWWEVEKDVEITNGGYYKHPLQRNFFFRLIWRIVLGMITVSLLIIGQGLFRHLFAIDKRLFVGQFKLIDIAEILLVILVWTCICHIATVILRLYLFKTRIFGEITS